MFDTKLKLRYLMLDWKYWLKNWRSVCNETTHKLILIDLVDDEDPGPQTSDLQLTMCDLKKRKIITHPIIIVIDHHFIDFTMA
jgi:hypothetical protein